MITDIKTIPFSCQGSYLVVSEVWDNWCNTANEAGLYLRTVHGGAPMPLIARMIPARDGKPVPYTAEIRGTSLILQCDEDVVELCFDDPKTLLFRGSGKITLTLDFLSDKGAFDYIYLFSRDGRNYAMANCYKNRCRYLLEAQQGSYALDQQWKERSALHTRFTVSGGDGFLLVLREIETEWDGAQKNCDFDRSRRAGDESLRAFARKLPACPAAYGEAAEKAAYLLWASIVGKNGLFTRDAMLMSKNWMKNVWSWDHCFNAIALSYGAPELSWDQFMLLFDCQDPTGLIPDSINDAEAVWNFCKPPIHGWALRWMMKNMSLTRQQTEEAYRRLAAWTNWWLAYRDYDCDGLCEYNHGNDSGWDNSTAFSVLPPVATPELQAFLIIQMDVLSDLAARLGKGSDAADWRQKSERLFNRTLETLFEDDLPRVIRSGSHEPVPNQSLLKYVSIVLGEKLPERIRKRIVGALLEGGFRTDNGFATESLLSPFYKSDGYWRGPIWAPSTMLLVDGLYRSGEKDLARDTARRFADMVSRSGFAENFDAVTGEGLRDRAYTWTASAFLAMAHEYLM